MKISKIIEYLLSFPKSLYVSFRLLPFNDAVRVPVFVRYNCKLLSLKGSVKIFAEGGAKTALLKVGFGRVGIFDKHYERSILQIDGEIHLNGKCLLGQGARLCVTEKGILSFGDNYNNSAACNILCSKRIVFGDNVLASWNTTIMDTDWHRVENVITKEIFDKSCEIIIGNNVWIGMGSSVLKGCVIPSGCIIAANAVVTKVFNNENTLLAGNPAIEKKRGVTLHKE